MNKRVITFIVSLFFFFVFPVEAQTVLPGSDSSGEQGITASWYRAAAETISSNLIIWGADYWLLQADYARISPETWAENMERGFSWDSDNFFINQILHPYQGSLYFNAARTNGFGFWESVPFTIGGSLMWEIFMESKQASLNDLITTTLGGAALGESSYRLSNMLKNRRAQGYKRVIWDITAWLVNPTAQLNNLLFDEQQKKEPAQTPYSEIAIQTGMTQVHDTRRIWESSPRPSLGVNFQYGDPHNLQEVYNPFDFFNFSLGLIPNIDNPTLDIFTEFLLWGRKLYPGKESISLAGIFQHFDFLENYTYKFACNGIGPGITSIHPLTDFTSISSMLHLYAIPLGGVESEESLIEESKEYSLGNGLGLKTTISLSGKSLYRLYIDYKGYYFFTLSGADSYNTVSMISPGGEIFLSENLKLGFSYISYERSSNTRINHRKTYGIQIYLQNDL